MAKSSDPNSATDQWFFNLANNASNLDLQNSGFTVFGQVIGDGMTVVEKISGLDLCQDIPMTEYSSQNCSEQTTPGIENFVVINQVIIIDSSEVTDADLSPVKNTLLTEEEEPKSSSGGGAFIWLTLLCLIFLSMRKLATRS